MPRNPDEITSMLLERIAAFADLPDREEVGTVVQAGDGIAQVYGLGSCVYGELLSFDSGAVGMAMNLDTDSVGCVLFSKELNVCEGETVRRTHRVADIPAGEALLGRVVDPLGNSLDGLGPIAAEARMPVERPAPSVIERKGVNVPLMTGILAIDAMVPIGRGQRELIIGDRQTGKTAIALDAIINQRGQNVICVYAAVGQKASSTARIVETLKKRGALDFTVVVAATAKDSAALQFLCPYAACAIAEFFMERGREVLVVYDDLSKHAVAYRTLSLLLRRPPGREAYPGDVFYLHSRLLERAARLSDSLGGGSMTALPIVETQGGDISAYIPTNVISITDGQVFLDTGLFNAGVRPAIDVGLSVSRVGGSAQAQAVRKIAGRLRIDLAQYRELAVFAQFGSDLDRSTQERLAHGRILVETLKQPQFATLSLGEEVAVLYAALNGFFASYREGEIAEAKVTLLRYLSYKRPGLVERIGTSGALDEALEAELKSALEEFKSARKEA